MATKKKRHHGQNKPPRGKPVNNLNDKERRVLAVLTEAGEPVTLGNLAVLSFGVPAPTAIRAPNDFRANSWTRNSLRNLVSEGYVINLDTTPSSYIASVVPAGRIARLWTDGIVDISVTRRLP